MQDSDKNEINTKVAALRETLKNGSVDQVEGRHGRFAEGAVYAASEKLLPAAGAPGRPARAAASLPAAATPATTAAMTAATGNVYDADYKEVDQGFGPKGKACVARDAGAGTRPRVFGCIGMFSLRTVRGLAAWE